MLEVPLSKAEKVRLNIETLKRETIENFKLNVDDSIDVEAVLDAALMVAERERLLHAAAESGSSSSSTSSTTTTTTTQQQPLLIRKFVSKHYDLSVELAMALEEGEREELLEGEEQITARVKALVPLYNPPSRPIHNTTSESSSTDPSAANVSSITSTIAAELHAMRILSEAQYLLLTHEAATRRREHEELITLLKKPLQKRGMSILELRQNGFTCANLRSAGYTLSDLLESRCIAIAELKAERFTAADLRAAGCSANELKSAFTASECRGGGFTFDELINAQYPLAELRIAGVSGREMVNRVGEEELIKAGYRRSVGEGGWSNF